MKIVVSGFMLGLMLAFSFGPGFWALIQISLTKSFKNGLFFLLGFLISDLTLILLATFSITSLKFSFKHSLFWGIIAAIVLVSFGIVTLIKKNAVVQKNILTESDINKGLSKNILKGFLFNMSNPYNFIFWLGIVGMSNSLYGINTRNFFTFIASVIITTISFDTIKCYFASKLQKILKAKYLITINFVVGIVMICSGVFIFVKTVLFL
jgi:threonine/homoserine/homoserine lactone efflux protein